MALDPRDRLRQQNSGASLANLTLPKLPYVPPPVDPREMPKWYEKFHKEHSKWVEKVNEALVSNAGS